MKRLKFLASLALFFGGTFSIFAQSRPLAKNVLAKEAQDKIIELS